MEIQDRNILLQQMLGIKLGNILPDNKAESGFAEMLKPQPSEQPKTSFADNLKAEKEVKTANVAKEKEIPVKKDKESVKEKTQTKETVKTNDKQPVKAEETAPEQTKDVPEEAGALNAQGQNDSPIVENQSPEAETPVSVQITGEDGVDILMSELGAEILLPESETQMPVQQSELLEMQPVAEETVELPKMSKAQQPATAEENLLPLTEEEALVLEQAKYLDEKIDAPVKMKINVDTKEEKIAAPVKMKINVDTKEEKIAAPVAKDVLKNRFEIDSLFQSVDSDALAQTDIDGAETLTVKNSAPTVHAKEMPAAVDFGTFAGADVRVAGDNSVEASLKPAEMVVSGKEVVFETANAQRAEAFARTNETASRDVFKGMSKEVVEQIKVNITKSAVKGIDTIDIQLKPEDLGQIRVKMHIAKDGKLQAEIVASRAETADMLQKEVSNLSKAFNEAGYDTDSKSFSFSFQDENAAGNKKNDSGLSRFIGDKLEQEAEAVAENDNLGYDPVLGLNIRV